MKSAGAAHILVLVLAGALLAGCSHTPKPPLPTVERVDLDRYLGTWYEIALLPNRFQAQCAGETQATYTREGEHIRVVNRCRREDGKIEQARGIAKVVPGSGGAKLRVSFFRPFYGDYWILALDPGYTWVLVGEQSRRYGWVLSRTPSMSEADFQEAMARASALGYEPARFRRTPQGG